MDGYAYTYDLSIPLTAFNTFIEDVRNRLGDDVIRVVGFGHLGNGIIDSFLNSSIMAFCD